MSPAPLTTTQRKRRLEIAQPEMAKRFLLLHRLNVHIVVSNKLGLGAWFHGIWNSVARNTVSNHLDQTGKTGECRNRAAGCNPGTANPPVFLNFVQFISGIFALVRRRLMAHGPSHGSGFA